MLPFLEWPPIETGPELPATPLPFDPNCCCCAWLLPSAWGCGVPDGLTGVVMAEDSLDCAAEGGPRDQAEEDCGLGEALALALD